MSTFPVIHHGAVGGGGVALEREIEGEWGIYSDSAVDKKKLRDSPLASLCVLLVQF